MDHLLKAKQEKRKKIVGSHKSEIKKTRSIGLAKKRKSCFKIITSKLLNTFDKYGTSNFVIQIFKYGL